MNECKCYIEHGKGDVEEITQCPLCKAAPDLLAACEDFMGSAEWSKKEFAYTVSDFCHSQIKNAIKKAK